MNGGIARHLEGWELGLITVTVAALGAVLAVPWSVEPREVPLPRVNERAIASALDADRVRAERLGPALERDRAALYDLRALGSAIRSFGRAESNGDPAALVAARRQLAASVPRARQLGDEDLLDLRAFEEDRFRQAIDRYTSSGVEDVELTELAGSFVASARANGWVDSSRHWIMGSQVRAIFFKKRWNEITGLNGPFFALSIDETKAFYRFVLDRPPRFSGAPEGACTAVDRWRIRKVDELAAVDAGYPRSLARGVLLARLGDYPASAESLREHLSSPLGAEYALLARNYLRFVVERASAPLSP